MQPKGAVAPVRETTLYGRHMLRLKIRLAKGPQFKDPWKACKDYSGMSTQRRKAAPPTEALAKYFASKMSLPGEEGKEVPPLKQAPPGARGQETARFQSNQGKGV